MHTLKRLRLLAVSAAVLATLVAAVPVGAGGPATTSVKIGSTATLVSPSTVDVPVTVTCPPNSWGFPGSVSVTVDQPQNTNASGVGSDVAVTCDGTAQKVIVQVNGFSFTVGDAFAYADAYSGFASVHDGDTRVIRIR
jgi:hypothetical protein